MKVECILLAGFRTVHLIQPCCPRLLHWSLCEQICTNYNKNVDYHAYPSRKQVIKAFTANDFQFFNQNSQVITKLSDTSIKVVDRVRITWHIQKNCQNNQTVTLSSDKTNTSICPILAALRLVLRARRLSQPDSMPVACYSKKDSLANITGTRITVFLRAAARAVRPTITKEDEQ